MSRRSSGVVSRGRRVVTGCIAAFLIPDLIKPRFLGLFWRILELLPPA